MSGNIRSRPTTQAYRDRWLETFGWKCNRCGTTNHPDAEVCHDCKKARLEAIREFCKHCGAGVGEHRREGEGTCPECDPSIPPSVYDDKFANLRQKMADDVDVVDLHDDLRDHANWLWGKFIDRLDERDGVRTTNFLGSVEAYKKVFMAEFDSDTD